MTKQANDVTGWYANYLNNWSISQLGSKPTADTFTKVHALGLRPGKQALAVAMYLRPGGATSSQVVIAVGAPQLNRMRGLIADKLLVRVPTPSSAAGHTVYAVTLTAKGEQAIKAHTVSEPAKAPAKAKGARKPKPATTPAPAQTPTSEPATATVTPDVQAQA